MFLIIMFSFAFVFMVFMAYCVISLISNFVFGYKEWNIKRGYETELAKNIAVLPLKWKEEKLQKWYVLLAIIFCGLVWMPSFVTLWQVNEVNVLDVNPIRPTATPAITEKNGIPEPYYQDVEKKESINELRETLKEIKYPHEYEGKVFDCSEMSSYTEWFLENRGFDTTILVNESWGHAWTSCSIEGHNVNIECVPPIHITSSEEYNHPEDIYVDIYEALDSSYILEFDWWVQAK